MVFIDDCFGEQPDIERWLEDANQQMKRDEGRNQTLKSGLSRKNPLRVRKTDFKEMIMNTLNHRGLHSLYLRLSYWINKLMKLMFAPK